ncbi:MAG: hypothetical protein ACTSYG_10915 [Candidatus Heimdallarchaeota archaeon]
MTLTVLIDMLNANPFLSWIIVGFFLGMLAMWVVAYLLELIRDRIRERKNQNENRKNEMR